jgi:hypothetical protein
MCNVMRISQETGACQADRAKRQQAITCLPDQLTNEKDEGKQRMRQAGSQAGRQAGRQQVRQG